MELRALAEAFEKAGRSLWGSTPVILGALLLLSLATSFIPSSAYSSVFSGIPIIDAVIGSAIGSILAGNPATSYIIGGELVEAGVSTIAVTAFLIAWVTVGVIQLPAESILLGKNFAFSRNISAFLFSILVAIAVSFVVGA